MSFGTIHASVSDDALTGRIQACIAQEQNARDDPLDPGLFLTQMTWAVSTASDVEAAYASALAAQNPNPGGDETVVTDGMILANVQANWPAG